MLKKFLRIVFAINALPLRLIIPYLVVYYYAYSFLKKYFIPLILIYLYDRIAALEKS